jgi:MazG family protein
VSAMDELHALVATLRGPDGCPWDRAQSPETMRRHLLEEAFEVVEAIDAADPEALRKELGDLLFLVVLLTRMHEEQGDFTLDGVIRGVHEKMVRRHPHVFGEESAEDPASVGRRWEAIKARERGDGASALDGVPRALPALLRAHRVGEKAAAVGFDWPDAAGPRRKLDEELAELDAAIDAGDAGAIAHELGDVGFTVAQLGRHLPGTGAEDALRGTLRRFEARFRAMEAQATDSGTTLRDLDAEALETLWGRAKARERDLAEEPG